MNRRRGIVLKSKGELEAMREAGRINAQALAAAVSVVQPGVTTAVINDAHEHGVKVILVASLFNSDDILALITDPVNTGNFFANIKSKLIDGNADGLNIDFESLKKGYFEAMGWDINSGRPWHDTLVHLGIDELTGDL